MRIGDTSIDGEFLNARDRLYDGSTSPAESDWVQYPENIELFTGKVLMTSGAHVFHSGDNVVLNGAVLSSRGDTGLLLVNLVHTIGEFLHGWELGFHHDALSALEAINRSHAQLNDERLPGVAAHWPSTGWVAPDHRSGRFAPHTRPHDVAAGVLRALPPFRHRKE